MFQYFFATTYIQFIFSCISFVHFIVEEKYSQQESAESAISPIINLIIDTYAFPTVTYQKKKTFKCKKEIRRNK